MKKAFHIIAGIVAVIAVLMVLTPILAILAYMYGSRTVYESASPANHGSAIFYRESGFLDTIITFSVRDYALSGSKPIGLGMINNGGQDYLPEKAVWSGDGTVAAILDNGAWSEVYDFLNHRAGLPTDTPSLESSLYYDNHVQHWNHTQKQRYYAKLSQKRSNAIAALLAKRGGQGQDILADKVHFRHVWWWEHYPQG